MALPAKRTPDFARYLVQMRGTRTPAQVLARIRSRGYSLTKSAISKYEHGRQPGLTQLVALSVGYGLDFADACRRLAAEITGTPAPVESPISEAARRLAMAFDGWSHEKQAAILTVAGVAPADPPRARAPRAAAQGTGRGSQTPAGRRTTT